MSRRAGSICNLAKPGLLGHESYALLLAEEEELKEMTGYD